MIGGDSRIHDLSPLFDDGGPGGWCPPLRSVRTSHAWLDCYGGPWPVPEPLKVQSRLRVERVGRRDARRLVRLWHRTHGDKLPAAEMARFVARAVADGELHGVALLGRPTSRVLADRGWLEVTRVASDGTPNVCSCLLGACVREARRRGAAVVVTYTLEDEPGTSLRAAGFVDDGLTDGGAWDRDGRWRDERVEVEDVRKRRWVRRLKEAA